MKNLFSLLLLFCLLSSLSAQDIPNCNASTLQLQSLEFGLTEVTANLVFSTEEEVNNYDLQHDFSVDGQPVSEIVNAEGSFISLSFTPNGLHTFTALNRCSDGTTHTGSTFSLDFSQEGVDSLCPTPTNLVIDMFNPGFALFHWDQVDSVDFWQVSYEPEGLMTQNFTVETPQVGQILEPTVRHTFSLYAVCDDETFSPTLAPTFSPTVRFSLIVIEDIKLLPIVCDSLTTITWDAYHMECREHGDFGPNKEEFVYTHGCEDCTTATNVINVENDFFHWEIYPNPTSNDLYINYELAQSEWVQFKTFDGLGRAVFISEPELQQSGSNLQYHLNTTLLVRGTYWLVGQFGIKMFAEKVIVR